MFADLSGLCHYFVSNSLISLSRSVSEPSLLQNISAALHTLRSLSVPSSNWFSRCSTKSLYVLTFIASVRVSVAAADPGYQFSR